MMTTFGLIVRFNDSDIIAQSYTDRTIDDKLIGTFPKNASQAQKPPKPPIIGIK